MFEVFRHPRLCLTIIIVMWFTMEGALHVVDRICRIRIRKPGHYRMPAIELVVIVGRYPSGFV